MLAIELMKAKSWFFQSRHLMRALKLDLASLLCFLLNEHDKYEEDGRLISHPDHGDNWFYESYDKIEDLFGWGKDKQKSCLESLVEKHIIEIKNFGHPCTRHIRFTEQAGKIIETLVKNNITRSRVSRDPDRGSAANCTYRYISTKEKDVVVGESSGQSKDRNSKTQRVPRTTTTNSSLDSEKRGLVAKSQHNVQNQTSNSKLTQTKSNKNQIKVYLNTEKMVWENLSQEIIDDWKKLFPNANVEEALVEAAYNYKHQGLTSNPIPYLRNWLKRERKSETASSGDLQANKKLAKKIDEVFSDNRIYLRADHIGFEMGNGVKSKYVSVKFSDPTFAETCKKLLKDIRLSIDKIGWP